ncbi:response regulator [Thalassobacillus pellis]|uniref:response regulator n=1 Tax=Thalassobacillus pellis TaxID=748008 RepID=UPI001EF83F74|nr:response regulator transcription factor [Thalassobacillus pellis]MBM7551176.1 two-component system NarL family response regulator [Thalassobacillus pellis]
MTTIKVLIADDHKVVRKGLVFYFQTQDDIEVVGEAGSGQEVMEILNEKWADVVLLDVQMPGMDGIDTTKEIRKRYPDMKIIMLTSFSDYDTVIPAIRAGANGYQLKDIDPDQLVKVIHKVYQGETMIDSKAAAQLMTHVTGANHEREAERLKELTKRELDVLREIMQGKSNKEIATSLFITEKTVKTHVSNLFSKLEVQDRTQAALFGVKYL